jgi:hypothetical protein
MPCSEEAKVKEGAVFVESGEDARQEVHGRAGDSAGRWCAAAQAAGTHSPTPGGRLAPRCRVPNAARPCAASAAEPGGAAGANAGDGESEKEVCE